MNFFFSFGKELTLYQYQNLYPLQNECFWGYTGILLSVRVSVCVQNTSFCQSAGGGIKSHLVGWLVVLGFKAILTAIVISWWSVMHMCFLAFSHQY